MSENVRRVTFGPYVLDGESRELLHDTEPVALSRKAMDALLLLVANYPRVVSKRELFDRVWPDCFVSEATLASVIAEIRRGLGESARQATYVRTVHGIGYKFAATVQRTEVAYPLPVTTSWYLCVGPREHPLGDGEYILGRNPPATIVLASRSVSRAHAKIVVKHGAAILKDLGSKNGTFLNATRIASPRHLEDGDEIGIGRFTLVLRAASGTTATQTATGGRTRRA